MPRGLLIVNPASGRGRAKVAEPKVIEAAAELGLELELHETTGAGSALEVSRTAPGSVDRVLVIGGDGTVNEVVNGLADREAAGGAALPVALIPMGTSNSAARDLGVPFDLAGAVRVAATGDVRRIDMGVANGRRFFLCAGAGPDAWIVTELHRRRTGAISKLTYFRYGARCFLLYGYPLVRVTVDGEVAGEPARWVVVANMSHYGYPLSLTTEARVDDGELDVCIIRMSGRLASIGVLWAAWRGGLARRSDVEIVRGKRIRMEAADDRVAVPLQVDGDPAGELPVDVEVIASAQGFLVPAGSVRGGP